jgi:hypothetical protein
MKNTVENTDSAPMVQTNPKTRGLKEPWKPGESGNPNGRPRKRPMSEAYDDYLREPVPPAQLAAMKAKGVPVKAGMTNADIIALAMGKAAVEGNTLAAKEMREAVEGKSTQRIELTSPTDHGFVVRMQYAAPTKVLSRAEAMDVKRQMESRTIDIGVENKVVGDAVKTAIAAARLDEDEEKD